MILLFLFFHNSSLTRFVQWANHVHYHHPSKMSLHLPKVEDEALFIGSCSMYFPSGHFHLHGHSLLAIAAQICSGQAEYNFFPIELRIQFVFCLGCRNDAAPDAAHSRPRRRLVGSITRCATDTPRLCTFQLRESLHRRRTAASLRCYNIDEAPVCGLYLMRTTSCPAHSS